MNIRDLLAEYPNLFDALLEWYLDPKMEFSYFEIHRVGKIIKGYGGKFQVMFDSKSNDKGVDKE